PRRSSDLGYIELLHLARWPRHMAHSMFDYFQLIEIMGGIKENFFARSYKKPLCQLVEKLPPALSVERRREYSNVNSERVVYADARAELKQRFQCEHGQ